MANIKSQKKRIITNEKARQRNAAIRSRLRTYLKEAETAFTSQDADQIKKVLPKATSELDRAVAKGVLHRNAAARKKSSLQRRAQAAQA